MIEQIISYKFICDRCEKQSAHGLMGHIDRYRVYLGDCDGNQILSNEICKACFDGIKAYIEHNKV